MIFCFFGCLRIEKVDVGSKMWVYTWDPENRRGGRVGAGGVGRMQASPRSRATQPRLLNPPSCLPGNPSWGSMWVNGTFVTSAPSMTPFAEILPTCPESSLLHPTKPCPGRQLMSPVYCWVYCCSWGRRWAHKTKVRKKIEECGILGAVSQTSSPIWGMWSLVGFVLENYSH